MREDDGHIAAISCPQRSTQGSLPRGSFEVTLHWRRRLKAAGHRLPHLRPLHLGPCPPPPPRSSIWGDVPVGGHLLRLLCADSLAALAFLLEFVLISATVSASFLFTFSFTTFTHFRRIRFQRLCKSKQMFVFQCNWSAGRNVLLEALILP